MRTAEEIDYTPVTKPKSPTHIALDGLKPLNFSSKDNTINLNNSNNDISLDPNNDLLDFDQKQEMIVKIAKHKSKKSSPDLIQGESCDPNELNQKNFIDQGKSKELSKKLKKKRSFSSSNYKNVISKVRITTKKVTKTRNNSISKKLKKFL